MRALVRMAMGDGRDRAGHDGKCWALVIQRPNKETGYHSEQIVAVGWDYDELVLLNDAAKKAGMPTFIAEALIED